MFIFIGVMWWSNRMQVIECTDSTIEYYQNTSSFYQKVPDFKKGNGKRKSETCKEGLNGVDS